MIFDDIYNNFERTVVRQSTNANSYLGDTQIIVGTKYFDKTSLFGTHGVEKMTINFNGFNGLADLLHVMNIETETPKYSKLHTILKLNQYPYSDLIPYHGYCEYYFKDKSRFHEMICSLRTSGYTPNIIGFDIHHTYKEEMNDAKIPDNEKSKIRKIQYSIKKEKIRKAKKAKMASEIRILNGTVTWNDGLGYEDLNIAKLQAEVIELERPFMPKWRQIASKITTEKYNRWTEALSSFIDNCEETGRKHV